MKYLPSEIEINGVTYYSGLELASKQLDWYNLGLAAGKSESYDKGWNEGYKEGKERRSPYLVAPVSEYPNPYNVGYEAGKKDEYMKGYCDGYEQCKHDGISKINLNIESVEQTELSKEYDKGFTKGYEEGFEEGKSEGYEIGKKANSISKKEIPGEYIAHIEEARLEGYKEGYSDAKEGGYAEGYSDDYCKECKEEPGRDDDDGEPIDDNQSEYDKGYYAGWEDGKNHIMQYI
jgi:hypothetical protein